MKSSTLCALGLMLVALPQTARAQPAEISWPGATWAVSTPEAEGIDAAALGALHADIEAGRYGLVDHFLLIRHGRIVADHHYAHDYHALHAERAATTGHEDWHYGLGVADPDSLHLYNYDHPDFHPYYQGTDLHSLQSVTKSVTAAALGIAVDEGHLAGVDVPVLPMFDGYAQDFSDGRRAAVTLEDLLTMRSGIAWNEMTAYGPDNSCIQMEASDDWIQFVLDQPMAAEPGTQFDYNSGVSVLLGKLVGLATGQRVDAWTEARLFAPIGIDEYFWKTTPRGEVDTEGGLYLSAHDLARIGYLFLRRGVWDGRRVLSEAWIDAATAPHVAGLWNGGGYGYQWWVTPDDAGGVLFFNGNGFGGQFVLVAPAYDLVAVFNAWNIHGRTSSTVQAFSQRILPAVRR